MENIPIPKPVMQSDHLDKFEKIYQKVVDAKTEKEKSSSQEMLKHVGLLETLMDEKLSETTGFVGEFRPSQPKKTSDQIDKELKDQLNIKKTYGVDAYGDNGLDSLDGILTGFSSKYEELK